jgi:excisionase family DNA binding protein
MNRLISTTQLADFLDVHPETVKKLAAEGAIPSLQVGRQLRFDMDAVLSALKSESQDSSDQNLRASGKVGNKC